MPSRPATSRSTGCSEPIGKQDQYIAAYRRDHLLHASTGRQRRRPGRCKIDTETLYNLEDNLLLFFTGYSRSASSILKDQDDKTKQQNSDMIAEPAIT